MAEEKLDIKSEKMMYAVTLGTLLSLDHVMTKDLLNLKIETLAKMYINYLQNAKNSNHEVERMEEKYLKMLDNALK
jgi:hypothetical protein